MRTTARSPRWIFGSIELPTMIAYDVPPPSCVGAKNRKAPASATTARMPAAIPVTRPVLMVVIEGVPGEA